MFEPSFWSLLPPLLAIVLAILFRQVFVALGLGIVLGGILLEGAFFAGLARSVELVVTTLNSPENAMVVLFTFAIGSLIAGMESFGGIRGFVQWLENSGYLRGRRSVSLFVWILGLVIFIESNITILVSGALARPLFDRYKMAREKLAYLIDSTSVPVCLLIPLNAWGAYNIGILNSLGEEAPLTLFISSLPYAFYAIFALALALVVALFDWNIGPMKEAEARAATGKVLRDGAQPMMDESLFTPPEEGVRPSPWLMAAPMATMVVAMPVCLYITGDGNIREGNGAVSVLWSVLLSLALLWVLHWTRSDKQSGQTLDDLVRHSLKGAQGMLPLALIILLALTLGHLTKLMGTGTYVAEVASANLPKAMILPVMFWVAAAIAFATGTSWGTFAIMIPVAVPAAAALGLAKAPFVAAALSGGVFGDHASPISDTTIMASMASATDHIDHVRTQLPYALIAGGLASVGYILVGLTL